MGTRGKRWAHGAAAVLGWLVAARMGLAAKHYWDESNLTFMTTTVQVGPRPWSLVALFALAVALAAYLTWTWERDHGPHRKRRH